MTGRGTAGQGTWEPQEVGWVERAADLAAENTRLRQRIADLETEVNTLAASLRLAATLIRPNRESQ